MDLMKTNGAALTMSSREIADLTGKEHRGVLRDIRNLLAELHGEGGMHSFVHTYTNPQNGQIYPVFHLPKRETLILVSGYSVQLRARIIDRWQELEDQANNRVPQTLPEALRLAADLAEQNAAKDKELAVVKPKAAALDRIATANGSHALRVAAKMLQMPERKFLRYMEENRWIYRHPMKRDWLGYADKTKAGFLEHKITTGDRPDGSEWSDAQVRVTPLGMTKLAHKLGVSLCGELF
jgi:phage regulator Rha-like protein